MKLLVIVCVRNTKVIFMGNNARTSSYTKHVDSHTKYVREFMKDRIMKILFVRLEDDTSDTMMTNIQGDLYVKHSSQVVISGS